MEYIINTKTKLLYNECDQLYVEDIVQYFTGNYNKIMDSFNLKDLDKELVIKLWDDNQSFLRNMGQLLELKTEDIPSWTVGFSINEKTDNISQIHYLSLKEIRKIAYHKENTIVDLKKGVVHEFVHICHSQFCHYNYPKQLWITEGIATYLSNQYPNAKPNTTIKEILSDEYSEYQNYRYIFDIIFSIFSKTEIQKILKGKVSPLAYQIIETYYNPDDHKL